MSEKRSATTVREFFDAIKEGSLPKTKDLVRKHPGLVNEQDESGMSGVVVAMYHGKPELADFLVSEGSKLDVFEAAMVGDIKALRKSVDNDRSSAKAFSRDGFTPLHFAAFFGRLDAADLLLLNGADVNAVARNRSRVAPLHSAVAHNQVAISRRLLSNGADPNAKQEKDFTPLHAAALNGNASIARLLLDSGAKIDVLSEDGRTPLDMTKSKGSEAGGKAGREEVAKLLTGKSPPTAEL
ncbi:MAG TPA: ankyrin repeat domain-containing protein [Nitrososphaerales archaeon]|nr:ankyrin repeat domain-containing protein [Nitrososphaerales archaeon]